MIMQLKTQIIVFVCAVALFTGIISGTCFLAYIKSEKKHKRLLRLGVGFLCVFVICCIGMQILTMTA